MNITLQAAKKRNEPLEHILLSGPPGLGKTTLAHIVAHEMNTKIVATSGPAIEHEFAVVHDSVRLISRELFFLDDVTHVRVGVMHRASVSKSRRLATQSFIDSFTIVSANAREPSGD